MPQKVKHAKDSVLPHKEFGGFGKNIHSGWPMAEAILHSSECNVLRPLDGT